MSQKVSPEVMRRVESSSEDSSQIPVIVTLEQAPTPASSSRPG